MKGLHCVRVRQSLGVSRWYVYAWRGGPLVTCRNSIRRPTFSSRELRNIEKEVSKLISADTATLASLVSDWRWSRGGAHADSDWVSLPPGVKRSWGRALDEVVRKWGTTSIESWEDVTRLDEIIVWRDSSAGVREANSKVSALRALLQFGIAQGRLLKNVADEVALCPSGRDGEPKLWSVADMDCFATAALRRGKLHVFDGMRLAALTGLARRDLLTVRWSDIENEPGWPRQGTMDGEIEAPDERLAELLVELRRRYRAPGVDTLLVDNRGECWTGSRFTQAFNRVRDVAGSDDSDTVPSPRELNTLSDLRTNYCAELIENSNLSDRAISAVMGWRPGKVASLRQWLRSRSTAESAAVG